MNYMFDKAPYALETLKEGQNVETLKKVILNNILRVYFPWPKELITVIKITISDFNEVYLSTMN